MLGWTFTMSSGQLQRLDWFTLTVSQSTLTTVPTLPKKKGLELGKKSTFLTGSWENELHIWAKRLFPLRFSPSAEQQVSRAVRRPRPRKRWGVHLPISVLEQRYTQNTATLTLQRSSSPKREKLLDPPRRCLNQPVWVCSKRLEWDYFHF